VDSLWIERGEKKISSALPPDCDHSTLWTPASRVLSLDRMTSAPIMCTLPGTAGCRQIRDGLLVHCIDEIIEGRTYHIEVSLVGTDRWRAHIAHAAGVPAAMMPFYGATPDEAARLLSNWLTLAHRTARGNSGA
jgi:hypothetical protein